MSGASQSEAPADEMLFPSSRVGRSLWLWAPPLAMMTAIFIASSTANLGTLPGGMSDHAGHFVGYGVLGGLLLRALSRARWRGVTFGTALTSWLMAVAYGLTDEFHQRFVPGRFAAFDDWMADAMGAGAAILIVAVAAFGLGLENRKV